MVKVNLFTFSHESVTCNSSPEISSTAFHAQPPDLPPAPLMDTGFAIWSNTTSRMMIPRPSGASEEHTSIAVAQVTELSQGALGLGLF